MEQYSLHFAGLALCKRVLGSLPLQRVDEHGIGHSTGHDRGEVVALVMPGDLLHGPLVRQDESQAVLFVPLAFAHCRPLHNGRPYGHLRRRKKREKKEEERRKGKKKEEEEEEEEERKKKGKERQREKKKEKKKERKREKKTKKKGKEKEKEKKGGGVTNQVHPVNPTRFSDLFCFVQLPRSLSLSLSLSLSFIIIIIIIFIIIIINNNNNIVIKSSSFFFILFLLFYLYVPPVFGLSR